MVYPRYVYGFLWTWLYLESLSGVLLLEHQETGVGQYMHEVDSAAVFSSFGR
jgi:hypothetical protein